MSDNLIRFDWAMKRLLRDKSNYVVLEGFLSTLLGEDLRICRFLESESNQEDAFDKFNRADMLVEDSRGRLLIVEVQNNRELDYFHRMLYGVSKTISEYINLGDDLNFDISSYKYLEHEYTVAGFLRTYMGLGNSKVFGFFNEVRLTYGYGQGKTLSGTTPDVKGIYQTSHRLQIGAAPGLTAFVTNNMAVEVAINIVGLDFKWADQVTNQVEHGSYRKSSANFKINIFSISLGICTYF